MKRGRSKERKQFISNLRFARRRWPDLPREVLVNGLETLSTRYSLSVSAGDLLILDGHWYITHSGLLGLARRNRCSGVRVQIVREFCDFSSARWVFKATVYKSPRSRGFVGYGDADPSNVSSLVHGAEMRVAETRAVNRTLRKAYGIGICSVEELGALTYEKQAPARVHKLPPESASQNSSNGTAPRVRDRLCQIIRHSTASWSRHMLPSSAALEPSGKQSSSKSRRSWRISPIGLQKTAMPCSVS